MLFVKTKLIGRNVSCHFYIPRQILGYFRFSLSTHKQTKNLQQGDEINEQLFLLAKLFPVYLKLARRGCVNNVWRILADKSGNHWGGLGPIFECGPLPSLDVIGAEIWLGEIIRTRVGFHNVPQQSVSERRHSGQGLCLWQTNMVSLCLREENC